MLAARRCDPRLWSRRPDGDWLWSTNYDGEVQAYDGKRWRTYGTYEGVTHGTWLVDVSLQGRVWAVGRGISTAEEGERWWEDHDLFSEIADRTRITSMAVDQGGRLWLGFTGEGAGDGGVCRYDMAEERWAGWLHQLNALVPRQVYDVRLDPDGTIWLAGEGGLSYHVRGQPWQQIPLADMAVRAFARDGAGRVWLATEKGIWSVDLQDDNDRLGPWRVPSPIMGGQMVGLARDSAGRLWVATKAGVSYIGPDGSTGIAMQGEVLSLVVGPDDRVWVGTRDGLYALTGVGAQPMRWLDEPVVALTFDADGTPWTCTEGGEILRITAPGGEAVARMSDLTALSQRVDREGTLPRRMAMDVEGNLWLATTLGLGRLRPEGVWELETSEGGLLSDDVRSVTVDGEGVVWMATAKGLARRRPDGRWTRFTTESTEGGLRSMEMWDVTVDERGDLWMATSAGLSRREPEAADWSYFDVAELHQVVPDPARGVVWAATRNGLYRVKTSGMIAVE
jgi:ligand-binding sensor domain-containing protein